MKRIALSIFFSCAVFAALANMATPWREGTNSARPFTNQWVDIVKEELTIKPERHFRNAQYDIRYHISVKKGGVRIPLLFIALDQSSDFRIEVDGKEVMLQGVPREYTPDHPGFRDFRYFFEEGPGSDADVVLYDSPNGGRVYSLNMLKYFTADLSKGSHEIHVSYKACHWQDLSDGWVKSYEFRYALSPARYWKSFGELLLTIDASECLHPLELQLDRHTTIRPGSILQRTVHGVPSEILYLGYQPKITGFPATLLSIGPLGIALIVGIPLAILHFLLLAIRSRRKPEANNGWIVSIGSFLVPIIFFWTWICAYDWIDTALGEHAARSHGYSSLGILILSIPVIGLYLLAVYRQNRLLMRRK